MGLPPVDSASPVGSLLSPGIGGMVSFITIVLTINHLIFTQELGTLGAFSARNSRISLPPLVVEEYREAASRHPWVAASGQAVWAKPSRTLL